MPSIDMAVFDPTGEKFGIPTYPWQSAPLGLATRRQLRDMHRSPGGHDPVAQLLAPGRGGEPLVAYLYDISTSRPRRRVTEAVLESVEKALRARRTCPDCGHLCGYYIPRRIGSCADCEPLAWGVPA